MTLDDLRFEIDKIDQDILSLFLRRMSYSEKIADIKRSNKISVLNKERENQILENVSREAGVYSNEAKLLFSTIMEMSRSVQYKTMR